MRFVARFPLPLFNLLFVQLEDPDHDHSTLYYLISHICMLKPRLSGPTLDVLNACKCLSYFSLSLSIYYNIITSDIHILRVPMGNRNNELICIIIIFIV